VRPVAGGRNNVTQVPCDADELIAALVHANAERGGTLELAEDSTYTLTAFDEVEHTGLPVIKQPITIKGNGATIVRGANAESFRILNVAEGGDLTLVDATIKGGDADGSVSRGGGGLLVQSGGKATVKHSTITYNRTDTVGGGIVNYGITEVLGRAHEKDGVKDGMAEDATKDDQP
jgi:hypothetical protein